MYSAIDMHLGCFHFLTTKQNSAMNIHIQIFVNILLYILLVIYLEVELLAWLTLSLTF